MPTHRINSDMNPLGTITIGDQYELEGLVDTSSQLNLNFSFF